MLDGVIHKLGHGDGQVGDGMAMVSSGTPILRSSVSRNSSALATWSVVLGMVNESVKLLLSVILLSAHAY
jgi:hypothetical protein